MERVRAAGGALLDYAETEEELQAKFGREADWVSLRAVERSRN